MTVKICLFTALFCLSAAAAPAQNSAGRHNVSGSLMGGGLFLSLNYEYRFQPDQLGWGAHAGIGYVFGYTETRTWEWSDGNRREDVYRYAAKLTVPSASTIYSGKKTASTGWKQGLEALL
jgi:hypothetical protein